MSGSVNPVSRGTISAFQTAMTIDLAETDFLPLSQCEFQHWGERSGPPFAQMAARAPDAAERVWRRTAQAAAAAWDGAEEQLDLTATDWSESTVSEWLRARGGEPAEQVIACFQPRVAVALPWRVLCDHWLLVLWTGGCVWPRSGQWVLVHDGDRFAFGRKA
jgi:hypothetical protein